MAFTVFISYAHKDQKLRDKLDAHLSPLRRQGLIEDWYDGDIIAGQTWEPAILTQLNTAQIILLLISPDFINSSFCYDVEMERALIRDQQGAAVVLPIILRPVVWQDAPFAKLQVLPRGAKPVTMWSRQDSAFVDIAHGIRQAIDRLQKAQRLGPVSSRRWSIQEKVFVQKTFWNVPPPNPFFTGREQVIMQLNELLHTHRTATVTQPPALSGLGGIGKTQMAIEYAYRYSDNYQHIFWVRAETLEELATDFIAIAHLLALPEQDEQDQTMILHAVKHWLETHSGWLLILDNADDLAIAVPYLPQQGPGHLLLTTRASIMGGIARKVQLETMHHEDGVLLLLRRAGIVTHDTNIATLSEQTLNLAQAIVSELGGLPLALDQAGAYIEENKRSLGAYLELYLKRSVELLQRRGKGNSVSGHPQSVVTTFSLSFEKVQQTNPASADLLLLFSFFHPDNIPEEILVKGGPFLGPSLENVVADDIAFDEALNILFRYSLIQRDPYNDTLTIHRLVQVVLIHEMNEETQHLWAERAVRAVEGSFPNTRIFNLPQSQHYLPQARMCASLITQWNMNFKEATLLLNDLGMYLQSRAQYTEARTFYEQAQDILEKQLESDVEGTKADRFLQRYSVLYNLAILDIHQGYYERAKVALLAAMEFEVQLNGPEAPDLAKILVNLATISHRENAFDVAESFYQQALTVLKKQSQEQNGLAAALNGLAYLYKDQERYLEADDLYQQAQEITENVYGKESYELAAILTNRARSYLEQKKYLQAEPLLLKAIALAEQFGKPDHPDVALSLNHLGDLYRIQGKYDQAEQYLLRALKIEEKIWGPESLHPGGSVLNHLGLLYSVQKKYAKAEELFQRALTIDEKFLGSDHVQVGVVLTNLAHLYQEQAIYDQAELSFHRAFAIFKKIFSNTPWHSFLIESLTNLWLIYTQHGKYEQAKLYLQQEQSIIKGALQSNALDTADAEILKKLFSTISTSSPNNNTKVDKNQNAVKRTSYKKVQRWLM